MRATSVLVAAVVASAGSGACGRVGFDATNAAGAPTDSAMPDAAAFDADAADASTTPHVRWVGSFVQLPPLGGNTRMFPVTPVHANDAFVMLATCADPTMTPTSVIASADVAGWMFDPMAGIQGNSGLYGAMFTAIAPSTEATTITIAWTNTGCAAGTVVLGDELTGNVATGGVASFDGTAINGGGDGNASVEVTAETDNDTLWGAAVVAGSLTAVDAGFTKTADNGAGSWAEYRETTDPAPTDETVGFTGMGSANIMTAVAIHPM